MIPETTTPIEQKLQNLRRVLWVCFAGVSMPVAMLIVLANFFLVGPETVAASGREALIPMFLLGIGILFSIAAIGTVCLVIYFVLKHRLERGDGIFL